MAAATGLEGLRRLRNRHKAHVKEKMVSLLTRAKMTAINGQLRIWRKPITGETDREEFADSVLKKLS